MKKMYKLRKRILECEKSGFTLLEIIVSLAIFAVLVLAVTTILIINMRANMRIQAKNYAREESAFMLNILKKDIRNAESIEWTGLNPPTTVPSQGEFNMFTKDDEGRTNTYNWFYDQTSCGTNGRIMRDEPNLPPVGPETDYATPCDIDFVWSKFDIKIEGVNAVIEVTFKAHANGMRDGDWITKEVVITTRNFDF